MQIRLSTHRIPCANLGKFQRRPAHFGRYQSKGGSVQRPAHTHAYGPSEPDWPRRGRRSDGRRPSQKADRLLTYPRQSRVSFESHSHLVKWPVCRNPGLVEVALSRRLWLFAGPWPESKNLRRDTRLDLAILFSSTKATYIYLHAPLPSCPSPSGRDFASSSAEVQITRELRMSHSADSLRIHFHSGPSRGPLLLVDLPAFRTPLPDLFSELPGIHPAHRALENGHSHPALTVSSVVPVQRRPAHSHAEEKSIQRRGMGAISGARIASDNRNPET